jgi:vacuolar-type H+-ATPase catalytic subunit A/Vma1
VLGGTCAIPGTFGCGNPVFLRNFQNILTLRYLFMFDMESEKNYMAEVLSDFPTLKIPVEGK